MKKVRVVLKCLACCALLVCASFPTVACGGHVAPAVHVSTWAELKSAGSDCRIVLDADIDADGETTKRIGAVSIDGNGHTISNAIVEDISMFEASEVKNLTLDGITLIANPRMQDEFCFGMVANRAVSTSGGGFRETLYKLAIENVHVKNSEMKITLSNYSNNHYYEGRYHIGVIAGTMNHYQKHVGATLGEAYIRGCSADNVKVDVTASKNSEKFSVRAGGIVGTANGEVSDCVVKNSSITVAAGYFMNTPYIGGLMGVAGGSTNLKYSVAHDNTITGNATWWQSGIAGLYSTSEQCIGGAIGSCSEGAIITSSCAENNVIVSNCSGSNYIGGFAGTTYGALTQCYAADNKITIGGRKKEDKSSCQVDFGGFCGYAGDSPIMSCFAVNNEFYRHVDYYDNDGDQIKELSEGGFAGASNAKARFAYCASYSPTVGLFVTFEYKNDAFCPTKLEDKLITNCYVDSEASGNANGCEVMTLDDWTTPAVVKSNLRLTDVKWKLEEGETPYFDFG